MKVLLLSHTPDPDGLIAAAARLCYSDTDIETLRTSLSPEKTARFVRMLFEMGHESPIEHVSFTFGLEDVSRSLLAQITRHRIASFSVQSQRYVRKNADSFTFVTPPEIACDDKLKALFEESMAQSFDAYNALADALAARYTQENMGHGQDAKTAAKNAEKKAIEDARYVLPNACGTKMILTMNVRSLRHFFSLRCCNRAQWEIRAVADEMLRLCYQVSPLLFAGAGPGCCTMSGCPEGRMSCGEAAKMRQHIDGLCQGCDTCVVHDGRRDE